LNRFARLARLHHTLWPYLQACSQGYGLTDTLKPYAWAPIWRPLWMHCPICPPPRDEADLIWIGPDLLYAPISRKGQRKKPVRLPPGQWYYLPEQRSYSGAQSYKVSTPLGLPPLFIREGTPLLGEVQAILQYNPESPPSGIALPQSSHR
jgi:alpha-glucosidase (family GH31 glycosyl hydrolase)